MLNLLATKIDGLEIAYIAVGILLGIAIIAAFIAQIVIAIGYWRGNRTSNSLGLSGGEYARKLLDQNGMPNVQVKKCGIMRTILFGNHYSITKRTVYLRMRTINKPSLTAVAMAAQKVALAEQHRDGDAKMIVRSRLQGLGVFAPSLFVPLVLIGFLVDLFVLKRFTVYPIRIYRNSSEYSRGKESNGTCASYTGKRIDRRRNGHRQKNLPQLFGRIRITVHYRNPAYYSADSENFDQHSEK